VKSAIYRGTVHHARVHPVKHGFTYRVFYLFADIDELEHLDTSLRWFSHNRFNMFSLHDSDHGSDDGSSLRAWIHGILDDADVETDCGKVMLLAYPRVLGYVFNPLSVWYCFGPDEELRAVVYEVRNTFGDKHSYVVPLDGDPARHAVVKRMHVSPFMDMDQTYRFAMTSPEEQFSLGIAVEQRGQVLFRASMRGERIDLSDRNLLRLFVTHPLVTLKSIAAIHWQALFIWAKRVGFRSRPDPATPNVTVVRPEEAFR
jgi:DUF1365 family protein